jgi:choline dehydrogenase
MKGHKMNVDDVFDYVIVGAGSAGCVLARRLVEKTGGRILLLEAGGEDGRDAVRRTDIGSMTSLWGDNDVSWQYRTVPQEQLGGRIVPIPQGRLLGGGSSVNAMMYVRGHHRDFDHWNHLGNEGWAYQDVLPYFRRSEDFHGGSSDYRGVGGPLDVLSYPEPSEVARAFVAAARELGFADGDGDYNGAQQEDGAFFYQSTRSSRNRRCSTADAFLRPVMAEANLTVLTRATVTRVVVARGRAVGVEFLHDLVLHRAAAQVEVIVTAGAFASPQLLMLSGIGPAQHLRDNGIEPIVDLPGVGRNLQDHLLFGVGYQCLREQPFPQLLAEAGLFTHTRPGMQAASPDLQLFFGPIQYVADKYKIDGPAFTFAPILTQPRSRGQLTLSSADPRELPVIDPGYLTSQSDVDTLVQGISIARKLVSTKAFAPFRGRKLAPGDDVTGDAELARYVRDNASTVWHPVGTCRMGHDQDAVVTPQLAVRGVTGLRVADASIMPTITSGNTNATTIMIAEKAADLIIVADEPRVSVPSLGAPADRSRIG